MTTIIIIKSSLFYAVTVLHFTYCILGDSDREIWGMANTMGIGSRVQQERLAGWTSRWLTDELSALSKKGSWEAALATFASVGMSSLVQPNNFHYTTVISACGRAGKWDAALGVFTQLKKANIKPNEYTFSALIHACSEGGKPDYALKSYALMQVNGVPPNLHTLTAVVTACAKGGYWAKALAVVDGADEFLIAPNVMTYTAAMDGCRRAGQWQAAVGLLSKMFDTLDVRPNDITWNTMMNNCGVAGAWAPALQVFAAMRASGHKPIGFTQECLEQSFGGSHLSGATSELQLMQKPQRRQTGAEEHKRDPHPAEGQSIKPQ
jgi:pentatricopeptide repeat domain-containing protein 1